MSRRRTLLAGLAAAGLSAACGTDPTDPGPHTRLPVRSVWSRARGRKVDLVTYAPSGMAIGGAPVCLLLHGLHGNARSDTLPGVSSAMTAHRSPFVFVAMDGGDNYWHRDHPGDDPMAMLLDEAPEWLRAGGFQPTPFAVCGVSMGGFGALLYARRRAERGMPVRAAAAISPGLLLSWNEMRTRNAFTGPSQWASVDPLLHPTALRDTPTGIWCGTSDHFFSGARRYIESAHPEFTHLAPGGHNGTFFASCVPTALNFLSRHCA